MIPFQNDPTKLINELIMIDHEKIYLGCKIILGGKLQQGIVWLTVIQVWLA